MTSWWEVYFKVRHRVQSYWWINHNLAPTPVILGQISRNFPGIWGAIRCSDLGDEVWSAKNVIPLPQGQSTTAGCIFKTKGHWDLLTTCPHVSPTTVTLTGWQVGRKAGRQTSRRLEDIEMLPANQKLSWINLIHRRARERIDAYEICRLLTENKHS